jgi:hypothetical protein
MNERVGYVLPQYAALLLDSCLATNAIYLEFPVNLCILNFFYIT